MQDMLYLGSIMKDMDGLKVLVVTSRSSKTSLMTAIIFSSQLAVCIQSINLATKDADTQSLKFFTMTFQCRRSTGISAGSCMESPWEVQWPYYCTKRTLHFGMVLFLLHPCVRYGKLLYESAVCATSQHDLLVPKVVRKQLHTIHKVCNMVF